MSAAITKQCLQLFDDDLNDDQSSAKSKSTKDLAKIGTSRKGIKKKLQKIERQQKRKRQETLVLKNKIFVNSTIEKYKHQSNIDHTEESLYKIHEMSRVCKTPAKVTQAIVEQSRGKLAKNNPLPEIEQDKRSLFTDRDFDKFEEEYDFFS